LVFALGGFTGAGQFLLELRDASGKPLDLGIELVGTEYPPAEQEEGLANRRFGRGEPL
jgi:hypothetical protein